MGVAWGGGGLCSVPPEHNFHPRKRKARAGKREWVEEGGEEEEEAGHDKRKERRRKKREEEAEEKGGKEAGRGGEGPAPLGFFLGWASPEPLPDRRPPLLAGLTGAPSTRVQLCAA